MKFILIYTSLAINIYSHYILVFEASACKVNKLCNIVHLIYPGKEKHLFPLFLYPYHWILYCSESLYSLKNNGNYLA